MPTLEQEREDLALADRHIAEGERRISDQIALVAILVEGGHDTTQAERLLRTFEDTLDVWHSHRRSILDTIARLDPPRS
ncbi:hypothetical protein [Methylobacterium oxalidis]|uniref:hypothetical protein n=1 Tax=Methylobacterium oxalidis TaxID=944322 RepID=UPI003315A11F